ncbi:MAG TPA: hypothetical protein PKO07_13865 [Pseudomonadota bacterium]|jgi:hypothetical protein|nr:hypothetical protein [Pseudomonadota bacterium]HNN52109.1 hypothetical protein [Pseudomonadota bacterium]
MSEFEYKRSTSSGSKQVPVRDTSQIRGGFGSYDGQPAPYSANLQARSEHTVGSGSGAVTSFAERNASAGLIGDRSRPYSGMMAGLQSSDVSSSLYGVEKRGAGNNFGVVQDGRFGSTDKYGSSSVHAGQGGGVGWSSWQGSDGKGGVYDGVSGGAGWMSNLGFDSFFGGFGESRDATFYRGVGGSAYSFKTPSATDEKGQPIAAKSGYGAEGNYTPFGIANYSAQSKFGPLGDVKSGFDNAYAGKYSAGGQVWKDENGVYGADGMFSKRTGVDNARVDVNTPVGNGSLKVGHASEGFQVRGGGYYDSKTGSFGANGEWNGGGYKIQNSEANVNIGNGAFTGNAKVGSWDTGDSFGGGAGWDAKRGVAWAEGAGNWGGASLKDASFDLGSRNKEVYANGGVGNFVTGGYDVKGRAEIDPRTGQLTVTGGGRGGGMQLDNANLKYGVQGLGSLDAHLGHFSNDVIVDGVKYQGSLGKESLEVGKLDGLGWRASDLNFAAKNDLLGTTTTGGFKSLGATNSVEGAKLSYDVTSLKNPNLKAGFDKLSWGGLSGEGLHAGIKGPGNSEINAKLGSFNEGFTGEGGSLELSREKGLDIGLKKGRFDTFTMSDLDVNAKLGNLYQGHAKLGEGYYNHFSGENANVGLNLDKGLYAGLENGKYRYLGGKDLDIGQSYFGGLAGNNLKVGEASVGGVDIGKLNYNSTLMNTNLTAYDVGAHGAKLKDLDYQANIGKLGGNVGAKELNALDLNIGKLDAHTSNFGLTGNADVDKARLDVLNVQGGHAGLSWGGKEQLGATGNFKAGLGLDHASGNYDLTQLKAGGNFKNLSSGAQLSDAHLNLFGHMIDVPDMGYKVNASGGGNVDLLHGQANGNLSLAGSSVNFAGHNITLGDWAQASGGVNLGQGAANFNVGGRNGVGADLNLAEGNLDLNLFGHTIDVDQGIRNIGSGISNTASSIGRGISNAASSAWDTVTGWF